MAIEPAIRCSTEQALVTSNGGRPIIMQYEKARTAIATCNSSFALTKFHNIKIMVNRKWQKEWKIKMKKRRIKMA